MHIIILLLILNDILLTISELQPGRRLPCRLLPDPGPPQPLTAPVYVRPLPHHLPLHSVNPGGHARKFSVGLFRAFLKVQMSSPECNYVSYEVPSHRGAHQAP